MITLVLGGARSGKSSYAEKIAYYQGGSDVTYLATAEAKDKEMAKRIKKHRQQRPADWKTIEEPCCISRVFQSFSPGQVILLDCLTFFISNMLLQEDKSKAKENNLDNLNKEEEIKRELKDVIKIIRQKDMEVIIVSNLVGSGLVPSSKLGREFRDIVGRVNQLIARAADEVYLCIAGLPIEIKEIGMNNLKKYQKIDGDL